MTEERPNRSAFEASFSDGSILSVVLGLQFNHLDDAGELFAQIHSDGSHDVLLWFQNLDWTKIERFSQTQMMDILKVFCVNLTEPASSMVPFFCALRNNLSNDSQYDLNGAFENWCENNPEMIPETAKIISDEYEGSNAYVASLIAVWKNHNVDEALQSALSFSNSAVSETRRQSIFALGFFQFETPTQAAQVEDRLVEIAKSSSMVDKRTSLSAMARILERQDPKSKTLIASFEVAASSSSDEMRDELIACLAFHGKGFPKELRIQIFDLMKNVSCDCHETIRNIDRILRDADLDAERDMIFEMLNRILNQETDAPKLSAFGSFKNQLKSSPHDIRGWYVINWLLEGRLSVCKQLSRLFPPLDLSVYDIGIKNFKLKPAEVFYLSRKIFAYFLLCQGPAVSLLSGCLMALNLSDRKNLEDEIVSFWLRNYSKDIDLFDQICTAFPKPGLKVSINRMRVKAQEYEEPLRSQLPNPALRPSERERRIQAEIAHERNKQVTRSAEENSFLASMFSRVTVLYGRSSVNYIYSGEADDPKRQIIPFQTIEQTSDLPRMECLYPSWMNYLIVQYRTEKRP